MSISGIFGVACTFVVYLAVSGFTLSALFPQRFEWSFPPSTTGPQAIFRQLKIDLFGGAWTRVIGIELLSMSASRATIEWRRGISYVGQIYINQGRWGQDSDVRGLEIAADLRIVFALFAIYPVYLLLRGPLRRRRRRKRGLCIHCAYDLTGNVSGVCPECGTKT